jgi:hypothetical protein
MRIGTTSAFRQVFAGYIVGAEPKIPKPTVAVPVEAIFPISLGQEAIAMASELC